MDTARVKNRFENQYVRLPEVGCWLWTGSAKNQYGHGAFKLGHRKSPVLYAHRFAWTLYVGEIPAGMHVLHRCDNPLCVNPHHLFLGTSQDNIDDMVKKDRHARGSRASNAKITEEIASSIKRMASVSTKALGAMFGISRQAVADIRYGRTWKHV